jgi:lipoprotein-anchoring transpeptidase ErfK/SrfK
MNLQVLNKKVIFAGAALVACCLFLLALTSRPVSAQSPEPYSGSPLCQPDAYLVQPTDCVPGGPSSVLTDLARSGMSYPLRPLPGHKPPLDLTQSPVSLAKINLPATESASVYTSLDEAVNGGSPSRTISAGQLRYVSIINVARGPNDKPYVQLKSGEWMRASPAAYPLFQGLVFSRTPANSFGWMVDHAYPRSAPGYANPEVGEKLYRETAVQIYQVQQADGQDWYQIGPGQWMERRYIRQVRINTTPPAGVTGGRWIEVNLYDQTLSVYDQGQLVFATMVATGGEPFYTRPGLFQIFQKKPLETMQGAFEADRSDFYYLEDVPWTMYFDQARALHGAYWRAWFGYPGTHGCVNLSIGDSAWLYQWAKEGDWVYVWDPSGQTPTDPSLYTAGGA